MLINLENKIFRPQAINWELHQAKETYTLYKIESEPKILTRIILKVMKKLMMIDY